MNININQNEIVKAIKAHIVSQGINLDGKSFTVAFTAGRKEAGLTADIQIQDSNEVAPAAPVAQVAVPPQPAPALDAPSASQDSAQEAPPAVEAQEDAASTDGLVDDGRPLGTLPGTPAARLFD